MATRSSVGLDGLKQTLDTLQLDPSIREEREYLASVLRRLGYTEIQIRQALGPAEDEVEEPLAEEDDEHRVIEIEVDEAEIPLYEIVEGVQREEPELEFQLVEEEEEEEEEELLFERKDESDVVDFDPLPVPAGTKGIRLTVLGSHADDELEEVPEIQDYEDDSRGSRQRRGQRMIVIEAENAEEAMRQAEAQGHRVRSATKLRLRVAESEHDEEFQEVSSQSGGNARVLEGDDDVWEEVQ